MLTIITFYLILKKNEHTTRIREFPRKKMVIVVRGNYEDIIR